MKRLTIQPDHKYPHYEESVVSTIALWRETFSLLPNLEELVVNCRGTNKLFNYPIDFAALFLSHNLKLLQVDFDRIGTIDTIPSLHKSGVHSFDAFLNAVPKRSPNLRTISISATEGNGGCTLDYGDGRFSWLVSGLERLLSSLCNLEVIVMCPMLMQPGLLSATSNLKRMSKLELRCDKHSLRNPPDVAEVSRTNFEDLDLNQTSFISLDKLLISSNFPITTQFLMPITSPNLTSLTISSQEIVQASSLLTLTSAIGTHFPLLSLLRLDGPSLGDPPQVESRQSCLIDLETFKPLSRLTQMRVFALNIPHQLHLSMQEFEYLVGCWPLVEELHIVPTPEDTPYLMPHALHSLAQHCPKLRRLTIGVNWDKFDAQIDADMFSAPADIMHKPMNLDNLDFGLSPVEESQSAAIAVFLVDLSISSSAIQLPSEVGSPGDAHRAVWKDIKKLMTIAGHYRRQIRHLRNELLEARGVGSLDSSTAPSLV